MRTFCTNEYKDPMRAAWLYLMGIEEESREENIPAKVRGPEGVPIYKAVDGHLVLIRRDADLARIVRKNALFLYQL